MIFGTYLILIQNVFLALVITAPTFILCKGKKKEPRTPQKGGSNESLMMKSATKPQDHPPCILPPVKEEKKEEPAPPESKDEKKENTEKKESDGGGEVANGAAESGAPIKEGMKEKSQKPFPKFEMPTESKKHKKVKDNDVDKNKKIKQGFYQEKSDEDDTLEKIVSLDVEKSDKTKRSQRKKK